MASRTDTDMRPDLFAAEATKEPIVDSDYSSAPRHAASVVAAYNAKQATP